MMKHEKEGLLHQRQLAFIGKMLIAFTQKIPHHLDPLQASAGRLANLLEQAHQENEKHNRKIAHLLSTIEKYLKILDKKTHHLNRFSQRMGRQLLAFNPGEVIEEAALFSTRLAHLRKVSIKLEMDDISSSLYGDPTRVHFLVSILIDIMLERTGESGQVTVSACPSEKKFRISIAGNGTLAPISASQREMENRYWAIGQKLAADLKGHLEPASIERDTRRMSLFLPLGIQ